MRVLLKALEDAAPNRLPGYLEECLARGRVEGDEIEWDDKTYAEICGKYSPRGAGDLLAYLARKAGIARAMEIIESLSGIPCGCTDRIKWFNEHFPAIAKDLQKGLKLY